MRTVLWRHSGEVAKQRFDVSEKNMAEAERWSGPLPVSF